MNGAVGQVVGNLDAGTLVRVWTRITARVVAAGFGLEYSMLERPKLGIFDGLKMTIDPAVDFEMQCFLVLHLFGHSVQWVALSYQPEILGVSDRDLEVILMRWSVTSATPPRFGLQLLHEAGITDLDHWFCDFAETDWKYVETFYRTGSIPSWATCVVRNTKPVEPLPIPPWRSGWLRRGLRFSE